MRISDEAYELLELLWEETEGRHSPLLRELEHADGFDEIRTTGLINVGDDGIELTEAGLKEAETAIRCHRLAERMLADLLDVHPQYLDEASCRVEHILHEEIEEKVCTLLGHPRTCPHGKPIPPGACCSRREEGAEKLVNSLAEMEVGDEGRVAYLTTDDSARMQELVAIGVVPGMSVKLGRKSPAYVFTLGQSEFAVDREMAQTIYVRVH